MLNLGANLGPVLTHNGMFAGSILPPSILIGSHMPEPDQNVPEPSQNQPDAASIGLIMARFWHIMTRTHLVPLPLFVHIHHLQFCVGDDAILVEWHIGILTNDGNVTQVTKQRNDKDSLWSGT